MTKLLVLRLSSMGDVLLTLPVMKGILTANPDLILIFVTRKKFIPYFNGIDRLELIPFDPQGPHKGLTGLFRLFLDIRKYEFKTVIDLHGILRTHVLDFLLLLSRKSVYRIRKHRKTRRRIIKNQDYAVTIPHTVDRYSSVFKKAGLTGSLSEDVFSHPEKQFKTNNHSGGALRIGIAPLSKHATKNWGVLNISELIRLVQEKYIAEVHLFGGIEDRAALESINGPDIFNHAGSLNPETEISLIRSMNLFISMDSANMHLASLAGTATISIWGATDPKLGFSPLFQPEDFAIHAEPEDAECRPCSVFGEIPCRRSDAPMICMHSISPVKVLNKINQILSETEHNFFRV